jgi:hypothetical protein
VFIREIRSDVCTGALLHVDLYQVRLKERMKAGSWVNRLRGFRVLGFGFRWRSL